MGKKLLESKEREDGIVFNLYEYDGGKGYKLEMYNKSDGRVSEYGWYQWKEEALSDFKGIE